MAGDCRTTQSPERSWFKYSAQLDFILYITSPLPEQPHPLVPVITILIITPPVNTVDIISQVILIHYFNAYLTYKVDLDSVLPAYTFWIRGITNLKRSHSPATEISPRSLLVKERAGSFPYIKGTPGIESSNRSNCQAYKTSTLG